MILTEDGRVVAVPDEQTRGLLARYLRPGDGAIDVGAHAGTYANLYARMVGSTGSVWAIDPDPMMAGIAERECPPWVTVLRAAVGSPPRAATLYRDADSRRSSLWAANCVAPALDPIDRQIPIDVILLDDITPHVPRLRGIKIDTQGAEWEILLGAPVTLANPAIVWQIELWPEGLVHAGANAAAVVALLRDAGLDPIATSWDAVEAGLETLRGHEALDVLARHPRSHA